MEKEKLGEEEKKYERIVNWKRKLTDDICGIRNEIKKLKRENGKGNQCESPKSHSR